MPEPEKFTTLQNIKEWGIKQFDYIKETKAYKIATSNALSRTISIVTSALVISSVIVASGPAAIAGLVAVGIGAAVDTFTVRGSRQLKKENGLLVKNRAAKSKQDYLLKLEPKIAAALEGNLYKPLRSKQTSVTERYVRESSPLQSNFLGFGKAVLKNVVSTVTSLSQAILTANPIQITYKAVQATWGLYSETTKNITIDDKRLEFQKQIDNERNKPDTPGYNNKRDLRIATRNQRIQTMAIQALIIDGSYRKATPEQIKTHYLQIKARIENTEKAIKEARNPVIKLIRSVGKDFIRAHNPFSKYYSPATLKVTPDSKLTVSMEKYQKSTDLQPAKPEKISKTDAMLLSKIKSAKLTTETTKTRSQINLKTSAKPKEFTKTK